MLSIVNEFRLYTAFLSFYTQFEGRANLKQLFSGVPEEPGGVTTEYLFVRLFHLYNLRRQVLFQMPGQLLNKEKRFL